MNFKLFPLCFVLAAACEPIEKAKTETEATGLTETNDTTVGTLSGPTSPTNNNSPSASTIFFNLSSALRTQHLAQIQDVFSSLSINIDGAKCPLSTSLSVSLPGEIIDSQIDNAFDSIQNKIESCLGTGADRVKIKGIDLFDFEKNIEKALGDNIVKACSRDADCARLPYGGYFRSGLGSIYSKKIQGTESFTIQEKIKDLMIHLANDEITDMDDFSWAVEDAPFPVPVPKCISNVCKGVNP